MGEHSNGRSGSHADTAGARLRLLQQELTQPRPRSTQPSGRTRPAHAPSPLNEGILDHFASSVNEVIEHGHTVGVASDAGPAPHDSRVYAWLEQATPHLDAAEALARDSMMARQALEHSIKAGDVTVIRRISCPACGCWGLFWQDARQIAACTNHYCTDRTGRPSTWTLKRLARHQVQATSRSVAT